MWLLLVVLLSYCAEVLFPASHTSLVVGTTGASGNI